MSVPTFLIIGAMKSGTTALHEYLRVHPDVFMVQKELHFFWDQNYSNGLEWYESLFAEAGSAKAIGEASPDYTAWPLYEHVPERAWSALPDAKLIYILRNPIDRLVSQYRQSAMMWGETRPIDEAVLDEKWFLSRSRYAMQLERWLDQGYTRDRLLLLTNEDLRDHRQAVMTRVFDFVGVDPTFVPPNLETDVHVGTNLRRDRPTTEKLRNLGVFQVGRRLVPPGVRHALWDRVASQPLARDLRALDLRPDTRRELIERLRPDLEKLRTYMDPTFDCWGLLGPKEP